MAAGSKTGSARQARIVKALKAAYKPEFATGGEDTVKIRVCAGSTCNAMGRAALSDALQAELDKRGLGDKVRVVLTGCHGLCQEGPIAVVHPEGVFYPRLKAKDLAEIVEMSVVGHAVGRRLPLAVDEVVVTRLEGDLGTGGTGVGVAHGCLLRMGVDRSVASRRRCRGERSAGLSLSASTVPSAAAVPNDAMS